uniref:Uncharacterized protein n=1 Tax=Alexandrium catenella TaxID=2925 RepID=A0A7S1WL61_ALECA|mmetsp:Transcript_70371/g.187052  ORF Transcript_70371/g.187052 Transcript_70371/m.187052 type:complete len:145 (+) Transcript_70371:85-519(+)
MLSVRLQKNPNLKQQYWAEVCSREDRPHLFHPSQGARVHERETPRSTMQSSFHGGHGLVHNVSLGYGRDTVCQPQRPPAWPSSLGTVGRSSLQAPTTPRARGAAAGAVAGSSLRGSSQGSTALAGSMALRTSAAATQQMLPAGL